jgi:hypothetical protein
MYAAFALMLVLNVVVSEPIYNSVASGPGGYKFGQYSTGQMLIDPIDCPCSSPIARLETPLL